MLPGTCPKKDLKITITILASRPRWLSTAWVILAGCLLAACGSFAPPAASRHPPLAEELVLYDWEDDIPQSVLDAFSGETGVKVKYLFYESQEDAVENMRHGQVYDVVVMENRFIQLLTNEDLLAELDYQNILNYKNISPNFRDLAYDPTNRYSIPFSWGTTGLVVRTDQIPSPIRRWSDLWDVRSAGKVGIWRSLPRETIALTLKSLGYSANSENPVQLKAALAQLLLLKPELHFLEAYDPESATPALASGEVAIAMGYSGDYLASLELGLPVEYVLPEEGTLLWGDNFVIPTNSPNRYTAELFINFLLRPEISAEIVNQKYYASANENAGAFIAPQIFNNPAIYPDRTTLANAEIILPLSPEGQTLYDRIWKQFLEAAPLP